MIVEFHLPELAEQRKYEIIKRIEYDTQFSIDSNNERSFLFCVFHILSIEIYPLVKELGTVANSLFDKRIKVNKYDAGKMPVQTVFHYCNKAIRENTPKGYEEMTKKILKEFKKKV